MTDTTVEAVTDSPVAPPSPPTPERGAPAPAGGGVPGVPLAVAGANTVGLAVAGASALAGPVGLVAVGTVGLATAATLAVRGARRRITARGGIRSRSHAGRGAARTTLRSTGSPAARTASTNRLKPGAGTKAGRIGSFTPVGTSSPGSAAGRRQHAGASPSLRGRGNTSPVSLSKTPRTSGNPKPGLLGRAGQRRQAGAPARAAKAAARTAGRVARGVAKAERQAGITSGATARQASGSPAQKKALRRSAIRHGARMAAAAGIAAGVGLVSGLWNIKRPGKATGHLRTVWRRLADRARRVRAARDARINGTNAPGEVAVPAERVNDPARTTIRPKVGVGGGRRAGRLVLGKTHTPRTPRTAGGTVSDPSTAPAFTRLSDAAEVMLQAASTFDPEHMNEFQALIDDLPEAMGTVQETLRVLAELSDEKLPVNPAVVEEIGEGYRAMSRVVDALEEVGTVYRRVHAEDIERNESPRKGIDGERRWNVG